jgi:hypothetical protein
MRADLAARLRRTMRGEVVAETGVTGVAGVAERTGLRPKPPELRQLRRLRLKNASEGKSAKEGVSSPVTVPLANDLNAIEERAALAADCVPACYLDAWARLQCQKPASVSEAEWRRALDDGGRFLDAWGEDAAAMQWSAGELFDVPRAGRPRGLVWQLKGAAVEALREDQALLADGRMILKAARERRLNPNVGNDDLAMADGSAP